MIKRGKKQFHKAAAILAVPVVVFSASLNPDSHVFHPPVLLAVPSADMLGHGQYELSGRFQYFTSSEFGATDSAAGDTTQVRSMNYNSELLVGIENRAEIGVQYGRDLSFSIKALLVEQDLFWPDLVFGIRNLFGSPEASLYGVKDNGTLRSLRGESYLTIAKDFPSRSRVHLGASMMNSLQSRTATVNAGLEQDLGAGAYLGYEVFERFSDFHQVLSVQWRWRNIVALSLGLTEFQSWIRQEGKWGFFLTPDKPLQTGYNSPGITASLQVLGWVPHRDKRTLAERVAVLEEENGDLQRQLQDVQTQMARMEEENRIQEASRSRAVAMALARPEPARPEPPAAKRAPDEAVQRVALMLRSIAEKMASDLTDPQEVRGMMAKLVGLGPDGAEALHAVALDTGAGNLRVPAVLVMAFSRDSAHAATLRALCGDRDARVRREALTALVKIGDRSALDEAKRLSSDPDEAVALSAGEAYRMLGGESARADAAKPAAKAAKAPATAAKKRTR